MNFLRRLLPTTFLILLVVLGVGFWFRHDKFFDWVSSRGYQPSSLVKSLVADTSMTPYAKRLFYANRPVIEPKDKFNKHCTDPSEQVAVLGCFAGNRLGIYLFDVTDERLKGIEEVTAAHEMLHQAYQRLNQQERTRVNGLLQEYHDIKATNKLKSKIASYETSEPEQLQNEMHSIFGTEAADLPAELEEYYKQYFSDRQKILALHQTYQSEFDKRIAKISNYDDRLTALKDTIETNKKSLDVREADLHQRRNVLNAYLAAKRIKEYNSLVPGFNATVAAYKKTVSQTNDMVDEFNSVLAKRNDLAVQERQLEDAIDSTVDTAPSQ